MPERQDTADDCQIFRQMGRAELQPLLLGCQGVNFLTIEQHPPALTGLIPYSVSAVLCVAPTNPARPRFRLPAPRVDIRRRFARRVTPAR